MENQHVINMLGITNQQVYNNRRDINNLMELWTSTRDQLSGGSGRTLPDLLSCANCDPPCLRLDVYL